MISCTEFIFAYSELFRFLEKKGGKAEVIRFWEYLSDTYVQERLGALAREKGLAGCYEYWEKSLSEEAADFVMTLSEGEFSINMRYCPSKGRLLEKRGFAAYPDYCEHCDLLYRRVLEPLGFEYSYDMSMSNQAQCTLKVRERNTNT